MTTTGAYSRYSPISTTDLIDAVDSAGTVDRYSAALNIIQRRYKPVFGDQLPENRGFCAHCDGIDLTNF